MKIVMQRVLKASVTVDNTTIATINRGLLVFLGAFAEDTEIMAEQLVDKMSKLRIFPDANGKSNLSALDVNAEVLVVSQFTLCADTKKGNRPSFAMAAPPDVANALYEHFVELCRHKFAKVQTGIFAADMKVSLINDGPYTVVLEA